MTADKLADGSVTAAKLAGDAVVRYYDGSVQGLDGLKSAGMYYAKHPASPPLASGYSALLVWELFGTYTQLAVPTRSSEVYIRYLAGGSWSAWEKVGKVPAGGVGADELAGGAVTPGKLAEAAVTEAKLSAGSVTETKLAGGAVTTAKIKDGAVTAAKLAEGAGGMPFQPAKALSPDTFITPGIYTDIPEQPAEDITAYGYLYIVVPIRTMEIYGSGSTFLYQVRINVNSGEIDMRYSRNNGAAWLDWTPFSYAQTKRETAYGLDNLTTPGIYETDIDTYPSPAPGYIGSYTILVASTSVETRQIWFCPSGDKVYMRTKPAGGEWSDFT